jgi:hypothetical protein
MAAGEAVRGAEGGLDFGDGKRIPSRAECSRESYLLF